MEPRSIAGRYTVERAVGHGGMGTVWLCRDELLGRQVAVKQVGHLPGESTSDVNRALREARSSAALNHPNVVSIYDAVEDGDHNWLVMEYVASRTLAEVLAQEGPMTPERATWIGLQAADGLAAAHARGTMHRDVKPGNILVTDDDHVKITDFGISRTHGDAQLTSTGLITGTPAYFAPETARGQDPGLPADVWALGATLYAAVEGHAPYPDQGNALALLTTIATQSAPLPRQAGVLTEAVNRMMDRDPAARWTMVDAAHALRRLHSRDAPAASDAGSERTVTLRTPVPIPVPTPTPAPAPVPVPSPVPVDPGDDDPRRPGWLLPLAAVLLLVLVAAGGALLLQRGDDETPSAGQSTDSGSTTERSRSPRPRSTAPDPTTSAAPPQVEESDPAAPEETESESEETPDAPVGDVEEFGERYYGLLPGDTEAAYALLSPSYGSTYEEYDGFWRTIEAVDVQAVSAVDDTTVDVSITYTSSSGATEDETRRLFLEPTDGGFAIVSDAAL